MRLRRGAFEKFAAHRAARQDRLAPPAFRGRFVRSGHALGHSSEDAVREARLGVRLEDDGGNSSQRGHEHHGASGITSDSERRDNAVSAKDLCGVPESWGKHRDVAQELHAADSLEPGDAQSLKQQPCGRHELRFHSALCPHKHHFPLSIFSWPAEPFFRNSQRRKNVPARSATCNQQFHKPDRFKSPAASKHSHFTSAKVFKRQSLACWLMFRSTPVARSIANKLEPP